MPGVILNTVIFPLYCTALHKWSEAQCYAEQFGFFLTDSRPQAAYWLEMDDEKLKLVSAAEHGPVFAEFVQGAARHRQLHGGGRGQLVAKAVGLKGNNLTPRIVDATAGLGRDAWVLATLGCKLVLLERSSVAAALLDNGLKRAATVQESAEAAARMQFIHTDASCWLQRLPDNERPDVVYLDPMFPEKNKNAASKKGMQAFQQIIGYDQDSSVLLETALSVARCRVVVKRPVHGKMIEGVPPSFQIIGRSTRFDVYSMRTLSSST